jgi:hypothetical protein
LDHIHLIGAEDVRIAANTMRSAAEDMQRAASNIAHALEMHNRFMDDWLQRLQAMMEAKNDPA